MATPVWLPVLEEALNRLLGLDPTVASRLERLSGRTLRIEILGLPATFHVRLAGGAVHILEAIDGEPDVTLVGGPWSLLRLAFAPGGERAMLDGEVQVRGDAGVLNELRACLAGFEVDWEEEVAKRIGDVPAHAFGNQARALRAWLAEGGEALTLDLRDYLWEEGRLAPRPEAVEDFLAAVDRLRDDLERLTKRVDRLAARLAQAPAAVPPRET
jgi:ubiquinone biosynthesis protein UbiJ